MKLFFYILQKLIKTKNIYYPDDIENGYKMFDKTNYHNDFAIISLYIYLLINDIYFFCKNESNSLAKAKLRGITKIMNNIFICNELKEEIVTIYSKSQKIYLQLYSSIFVRPKYPFIVTDDLLLNPIDVNNYSINTHIIIQDSKKYAFNIQDLCNIIESALGNASMFFPEPLRPKNPYNNNVFSDCDLYNIYFKMKYSTRKISTLFHLYFLDNFDNNKFLINNELYLRDNAIKRFVYKSPSNVLVPSILHMLNSNFYTRNLEIHENFPENLLVSIFQPFLYYYFIIMYYLKTTEKYNNYYDTLGYKLKEFYLFNPSFGRQIINLETNKKKKIIKKEYNYNTKHISFHNIK
jgi:hypothetical protein